MVERRSTRVYRRPRTRWLKEVIKTFWDLQLTAPVSVLADNQALADTLLAVSKLVRRGEVKLVLEGYPLPPGWRYVYPESNTLFYLIPPDM